MTSCNFAIYADILPAGWIFRSAVNFSHFIPLDKVHVPENLWKLSVTYLLQNVFWLKNGANLG